MASLMKIKNIIAPLTANNNGIIYNVIRTKVYTNFDYMPGPRPKTEEEMKKAAKKYGLHPAEYKLYPDDGMHPVGDYPHLPDIGTGLKDPYYPYDYPDERRNYGETIHHEINIMGEERCDIGEKPWISYRTQTLILLATTIVMFGLSYLCEPYPMFRPALKQQMYEPGAAHYTFEPAK
ncbi:hypothetical protein PV326_000210 [Microctonus aethiopoides]|uniref:NADH dehydrogenase [ubiquinone] 1 beta subcomplex subunit 8, mitochondrial n=1 Tax=Microctonus aethiopoides TaxID=144406 RepID=A0AA39FLU3_9HYME|nr:hypothetical protein PV326_000210 [Microctonus aethiopoides]KAK0172005.1 hypothetical protein PV328_005382 [Microctonus aethiopoides]